VRVRSDVIFTPDGVAFSFTSIFVATPSSACWPRIELKVCAVIGASLASRSSAVASSVNVFPFILTVVGAGATPMVTSSSVPKSFASPSLSEMTPMRSSFHSPLMRRALTFAKVPTLRETFASKNALRAAASIASPVTLSMNVPASNVIFLPSKVSSPLAISIAVIAPVNRVGLRSVGWFVVTRIWRACQPSADFVATSFTVGIMPSASASRRMRSRTAIFSAVVPVIVFPFASLMIVLSSTRISLSLKRTNPAAAFVPSSTPGRTLRPFGL